MTRRHRQRVVIAITVLLVIAQVIAFVIIRRSRGNNPDPTNNQPVVELAAKPTDAVEHTAAVVVDAAPVVEPPVPPDATEVVHTRTEPAPPAPVAKPMEKPSRADLVALRQREQRERERKLHEEQQREEERKRTERIEIERKRTELEREKAEQARIALDLEKQRFATERAKAEAETAKLAAERARESEVAQPATPRKPAGSPDVLVLVLGLGVPNVGIEQIRNVYLGRTSVWPNGTSARPMNRSFVTAAARKFFGGVLRMTGGEFLERWSELQLGGGGIAPPTISSASALIAKVAATQGGFGYVLESELPENTGGVRLVRLE